MLRLFVALPIPKDISTKLQSLSGGLPGARWLPPENYHLTLRFVGEIDRHQADDLDAALSLIGEPIVDINLNGLGHFGKKGLANCLIATAEKTPSLLHLQQKIERAMVRCGFKPETRKFLPHITLARMKPMPEEALDDYAAKCKFPLGLNWSGDRFTLFSSFLRNTGSIYTPEIEYPLSGGIDEDWAAEVAEEYPNDYTFEYKRKPKSSRVQQMPRYVHG